MLEASVRVEFISANDVVGMDGNRELFVLLGYQGLKNLGTFFLYGEPDSRLEFLKNERELPN